jgi:hypothetical protein
MDDYRLNKKAGGRPCNIIPDMSMEEMISYISVLEEQIDSLEQKLMSRGCEAKTDREEGEKYIRRHRELTPAEAVFVHLKVRGMTYKQMEKLMPTLCRSDSAIHRHIMSAKKRLAELKKNEE